MTLFKSVNSKTDDNYSLPQMILGNSGIDGEDYQVVTNNLKCDEVPEPMTDAKTASEFIAGLLNCYFNKVDATKFNYDHIQKIGIVENEDEHNPNQLDLFNLESDNNPKRPF